METKEKYMGESPIKDVPKKNLGIVIRDGAITYNKLSKETQYRLDSYEDLQAQINALQIGGLALSQRFGNDPYIGISQKTLTDAINRIWQKISDITGEVCQGISMVVNPPYYFGEGECNVHISATSYNASGIFEHIAFYINGELVAEADDVERLEYDTTISDTTEVMCKATMLGIEYTKVKTIVHYDSFWLGAGSTYADVMDVSHVIPATCCMRGAYDVDVSEGDHIIVVVGEYMKDKFIRADINGIEIQFNQSIVTVDGNEYRVFTSVSTYDAGIINVDING